MSTELKHKKSFLLHNSIGGSKKSRFLVFSEQVRILGWFSYEKLWNVCTCHLVRGIWHGHGRQHKLVGNTCLTPFPNLLCTQYVNWVYASHLLVLQSKREYKVNSQMCMYTSDKKQLPLWLFVRSFNNNILINLLVHKHSLQVLEIALSLRRML